MVDPAGRLVGVVSREAVESVPGAVRAGPPVALGDGRDDGGSGLRAQLEDPLEALLTHEGLAPAGRGDGGGRDGGVLRGIVTDRPAVRPGTARAARYARSRRIESPAASMPHHDVLVIGAGLAGQRAALAAAEAGRIGRDHLQGPPGPLALECGPGRHQRGAEPEEDSWESHAFDTIKGSDYLGDQDAIEIMCREAPGELLDLEHLGVTFHRNEEGRLGTRAFGGASAARTYYVADITGQAILHVLYEQLMKHDEVHRYEEWFTTALGRTTTATSPARSPATSATARSSCSRPRR